jgi:hypothetical protein
MSNELGKEEQKLTQEEIRFIKEDIADRIALTRTLGRIQKYALWVGAAIGAYAILGEKLPELIKKWLG